MFQEIECFHLSGSSVSCEEGPSSLASLIQLLNFSKSVLSERIPRDQNFEFQRFQKVQNDSKRFQKFDCFRTRILI